MSNNWLFINKKNNNASFLEGDVVLLAGKGHETYQDVMGEKRHYDEREIVREILESQEV